MFYTNCYFNVNTYIDITINLFYYICMKHLICASNISCIAYKSPPHYYPPFNSIKQTGSNVYTIANPEYSMAQKKRLFPYRTNYLWLVAPLPVTVTAEGRERNTLFPILNKLQIVRLLSYINLNIKRQYLSIYSLLITQEEHRTSLILGPLPHQPHGTSHVRRSKASKQTDGLTYKASVRIQGDTRFVTRSLWSRLENCQTHPQH